MIWNQAMKARAHSVCLQSIAPLHSTAARGGYWAVAARPCRHNPARGDPLHSVDSGTGHWVRHNPVGGDPLHSVDSGTRHWV